MVVISNAPFSAGLSFGTSHRGSNSSCQQQPFTYLFSQYISLDSNHFTSGICVSPPLRFFHYMCARHWMCGLRAHTHNACKFFNCSLWVCVCLSTKSKEYLHTHTTHTHVYPWCHASLEYARGLLGLHSRGGSLWRTASVNPLIICTINSHLLDLASQSILQHSS